MTQKTDTYEQMKPSGLPFLGDIPAHWTVDRLSAVGRFGKGKGGSKRDDTDQGVACVRYGEIYTTYADRIVEVKTRIAEARSTAYSPIQRGDVLLTASGEDLEEIGQAAVYLSDERAVCGGDLVILRPSQDFEPLFLSYALNSRPSVWQKAQMGRGTTVKHIYPTQLRSLACAVPPVSEQRLIARFVSNFHSRADRAIAAKRKTIGLLNEQKQAIIHQAVTRGLDPTVPLKPSGMPWLGDIPAHWTVSRLSAVGRFGKGKGGSKQDDTDRGVSCIRYGEIYTTYADRIVEVRTRIAEARSSSYSPIQRGDVLLTASGEDLEEIGQAAVYLSDERAVCGGDLVILRPSQGFDPLFLSYALNSRSSVWQKAQMGRGTTVKHIYQAQLRSLTCAFPPPAEQQAIVAFVDEQSRRVETGTAKLERECELLTEYRTRLTSDVVTGKLDVREAAKALTELDGGLAELVEIPTSDADDELELAETP